MALGPAVWKFLRTLDAGKPRYAAPLRKKLGDENVETLLRVRHLEMLGQPGASNENGQLARTPLSVTAVNVFDALPESGQGRGAAAMMQQLALKPRTYEAAVALLQATGEVQPTSGPHRAIRRLVDIDRRKLRDGVARESDLYGPFRDWLVDADQPSSAQFDQAFIVGAGAGHPRATGQWTKPDVVRVTVNNLPLLPSAELSVSAYELKRFDQSANLSGVYEAAAHQRQAHFASLVVEWPLDDDVDLSVRDECRRHGVGLFQMWGTDSVEILPPERRTPDPSILHDFLSNVLASDPDREAYLRALGRAPERALKLTSTGDSE